MKHLFTSLLSLYAFVVLTGCSNKPPAAEETKEETKVFIREETVTYTGDDTEMTGFIAYNTTSETKRPVILVVHEWWGQTDYPKSRAKQLAEMGYLAFAVDMFGQGMTADDPKAASDLAMPFYTDPMKAKRRFDAALARAKQHPMADTTQVAAIGYCFGGSMVLNMARLGVNLDGVVSFHGNLQGVPPSKDKLKAAVLVCHGEDDKFVSEKDVQTFKHQMDSIGANYTFKSYPGATHAFSNPAATEKGKKYNMPIAYNSTADTASWKEMQAFFGRLFKK